MISMVLSDRSIRSHLSSGKLVIDPMGDSQIQPASVDLRLGSKFKVRHNNPRYLDIDPFDLSSYEDKFADVDVAVDAPFRGAIRLPPRQFMLGVTKERVKLPDILSAYVDGKSSLGRLGLLVHITAGNIDPGFDGHITLEILNVSGHAIILTAGMKCCQIRFHSLTTAADCPYNGKYVGGSDGPVVSKYYLNERPKV